MAEYYNRSKKRTTEPANPGSEWHQEYRMAIDLTGHKYLEEDGQTNIYDKIQESLEETKIENIIRRAVGGDEAALAVMHGQYLDTTNMPKSLAEMQQSIIAATEEFYKLPLEIRQKFDQSPEQFIAEYGSEEWMKKLSMPETIKQNDENKTNEGSRSEA